MEATANILEGGQIGARAGAQWLVRLIVAAFAVGVAADVLIASYLGSTGSGNIVVSAALGMPLVVAGGWRILKTGRLRPASAPLILLTAFTGWAALSVFWATDTDAVVSRSITNVQLLASVWLCWQIVRSESDLRAMLFGFLAGCAVIVVSTWVAFSSGNAFQDTVFEGGTRYAAQGFDPNDMAVTLALGIPMSVYLTLAGGRRRSYLMLLYLPLAGVGIALSGSRGGALTAVAAVVCTILWLARRSRTALAVTLALVAVAVAGIASSIPWDTLSRLLTIREQLGGTVSDREMIWRAALDLLEDHPLVGIAAGGFSRLSVSAAGMQTVWRRPPMPVVHNTPLSVAVELGAIGFLLFFGAFALAARGAARRAPNRGALAMSLVLTWLVGTASLTWESRKATWFVVLVGAVLGGLRPPRNRTET